jgi:hypothetical protein
MAKVVNDILINPSTYDLVIGANGDFKLGDGTVQHQQHILLAGKGDYKLTPLVGVNIFNHLHDHSLTLARDARIAFIADGMKVNSIKTINNKLEFNATY